MTNPTNPQCHQRRLRSDCAQSDQSSLCTQYVAKNPRFLHADSEDSDQTGRMLRQILVFAGRICDFVDFNIVDTNLAQNMSSNFVIWVCRYPIIDLAV